MNAKMIVVIVFVGLAVLGAESAAIWWSKLVEKGDDGKVAIAKAEGQTDVKEAVGLALSQAGWTLDWKTTTIVTASDITNNMANMDETTADRLLIACEVDKDRAYTAPLPVKRAAAVLCKLAPTPLKVSLHSDRVLHVSKKE